MLTSIVSLAERNHNQPHWILLALTPLGAALCAGFLTPLAALMAIAVQLLRFIPSSSDLICLSVTILNTLALAILGPGAYSVDALLFGRRLLLTNRDH